MLRGAALSLVVLTLITGACSRRQAPVTPTPQDTAPDTAGEGQRRLDQMRADSIRRAEEERRRLEAEAAERNARVRAVLEEMVFFDYDQSDIRADMQDVLNRKAALMRANPNVALRVDGHADERGTVEYNLALSLRRANAVREYMTGFGIDAGRLDVSGFGEERPLDTGGTEEAFAKNRRAEFSITRGGDNLVPAR